jgi:hypothetical protein
MIVSANSALSWPDFTILSPPEGIKFGKKMCKSQVFLAYTAFTVERLA